MTIELSVFASSAADALGYRGQHAICSAVQEQGINDYRIIGGHMVRLLLHAFPTPRAAARTTIDADAGLGGLHLLGPVADRLRRGGFTQIRGNTFAKLIADSQEISVDLIVPSDRRDAAMRAVTVPGVGQVDSLPAMGLVMDSKPVSLAISALLAEDEILGYTALVPGPDMALLLKAASWSNRRHPKDVADIATLLEIRQAHPELPWSLDQRPPRGRRLDASRQLHALEEVIRSRATSNTLPPGIDRTRLRALIREHVSLPV